MRKGLRARVRPGTELTDRERAVIEQWDKDRSPARVAEALDLTVASVRTALQSIRIKMETPGVGGTQRAFEKHAERVLGRKAEE